MEPIKNNDEELQKDSPIKSGSSHSASSFEIHQSSCDLSTTSGSHPDDKASTLIDLLNNRELSCQNLTSSGDSKWGSISSCYPSTNSSSHHSGDTPNTLSSPEHQSQSPFVIPKRTVPVPSKYCGFSSDSTSSDSNKEASPKRELKAKSTSDLSVSSGESQDPPYFHQSTPAELSSREVTHLDMPALRSSTPAEVSFECLQLSGESSKRLSPDYSLPDHFSASPCGVGLTEPHGNADNQLVGCAGKIEKPVVDIEKVAVNSLPKWVKDEREKRIGDTFFSESTDFTKSSSSAASSPLSAVALAGRQLPPVSPRSASPLVPASKDLPLAQSQNVSVEPASKEDYDESCVYPLQDCTKKANVRADDSVNVTVKAGKTVGVKGGGKDGENDVLDVSSPSVILPSQSSSLSINTKIMKKMSSVPHGESSSKRDECQSQNEGEPARKGLSLQLGEPQVSQVKMDDASDVWEKKLKKSAEGTLSKDFSLERLQKDFSHDNAKFDKDSHLEMSQDLFDERVDQIETSQVNQNLGQEKASQQDKSQDFCLFLSQTQNELNPRFEIEAVRSSIGSVAPSFTPIIDKPPPGLLYSAKAKEELTDAVRQDSLDNATATPSQSILSYDKNPESTLTTTMSVEAEPRISVIKDLEIPKDVLSKVDPCQGVADLTQEQKSNASQSEECVTPSHPQERLQSIEAAVLKGTEMKRTEDSEGPSDVPKITALLTGNVYVESACDFSNEQSSSNYSKALKASDRKEAKEGIAPSPVKEDPFAFNENGDEDVPPTTTHGNTAVESSTKLLPLPTLPKETLTFEAEEMRKVVTQIISVTEVTTVRKRTVVTEVFEPDGTLFLRTEFPEKEVPVKTVNKEPSSSTIEFVPLSSWNSDLGRGKVPGKRVLKKQTPTRSSKKSPAVSLKRRRSSSSTPPDQSTGVPKRRRDAQEFTTDEYMTDGLGFFGAAEVDAMESAKPRKQTRSAKKAMELGGSSFFVGMKGLGKWSDNRYYPGKIIEKTNSGSYRMRFHDKKELELSANAIIPQDMIQQGQSVYALNRHDGFYYEGTICRIDRTRDGVHSCYHIKLKNSSTAKKFYVDDIMLNAKQKSELERKTDSPSGTKDNTAVQLSSHNQGRRNSIEPKVVENLPAEAGRKPKQASINKGRCYKTRREDSMYFMISSSSPEIDSFQFRMRPKRRKIQPVSDQQASTSNDVKQMQHKVREIKDPILKTTERWKRIERLRNDPKWDEKLRLYGSLPENPTLFRGFFFLITFIQSKSNVDEDVAFICKDFRRSHVACQVTAGGGSVVDSVRNLKEIADKKFVLIAPTHQKTLKYYFALCYGFPCVTHYWVTNCCKENQILPFDNYLLEAGIDEITGHLVYPHKRTQPLRGFKIYVSAVDGNRDEYALAVKFSGAEIVPELPNVKSFNTRDVDFILLGDNIALKRGLVSLSKRLGVPCVTLNWFYQCVIRGEYVDPESSDVFIANIS